LQALETRQAFDDESQLLGGMSGGKCLIVQISFQVFFKNVVIESLDRIDFRGNHTKSSRTGGSFGAALTDQAAGSRMNNQVCHLAG